MHAAKEHGGIAITGVVSTLSNVQGGLINKYVDLGCENKNKKLIFPASVEM